MAYQTIGDLTNSSAGMALFQSISLATNSMFFPLMLFMLWLFGAGASYFTILKLTGKKRFWHSLTSMSFVMFLASLLLASMNTTTAILLNGYWVGFYILMTLGSWYALTQYK